MQNLSNAVNPRQHSKNTYEIFTLDLTLINITSKHSITATSDVVTSGH